MIDWVPQAVADMDEITAYLEQYDQEIADATEAAILNKIEWLEKHAMAGSSIAGLHREYKIGYAIKAKFKIYYKVVGYEAIKIIMVRRSEKLPPSSQTLRQIEGSSVNVSETIQATPSKIRKTFLDVLGEAPSNSIEYRLYQGQSAGISNRDIEVRVEYLQKLKSRDYTAAYKKLAIAYLQEELGRRRRGEI